MARRRFTAVISGRVQGVGFRYFAREAANELGVTGYVRNTSDGNVEVLAEGDEDSLQELLKLLKQGPRAARVMRVETSWGPPTDAHSDFHVSF